jgi:hypothetical protein
MTTVSPGVAGSDATTTRSPTLERGVGGEARVYCY